MFDNLRQSVPGAVGPRAMPRRSRPVSPNGPIAPLVLNALEAEARQSLRDVGALSDAQH